MNINVNTTSGKSRLRCAIYTRKSSEEGLEQSFNSLDAQREACESFILSQRQEGWRLLAARYDDGGYSGGSMERPGLQRLLMDVDTHGIDVVVVYKVDRLTRSLADFAKIIEILDAHQVSFVSVTQQFNTTSSMGRLTLNVLLSFAQFEREVTGERIRDKIAASKRRGMWMGGRVPIGYDLVAGKLVVNPEEAKLVRTIFELYVELGSVAQLQRQLELQGVRSKLRSDARGGSQTGGCRFSRGALYRILQNPTYVGEVRSRQQCHAGEHSGILARELWDKVQVKLLANRQGPQRRFARSEPRPLKGLLEDPQGNLFSACHAHKRNRHYRYYVLRQGSQKQAPGKSKLHVSLPAYETELLVSSMLQRFFQCPGEILDKLSLAEDTSEIAQQLVLGAPKVAQAWATAGTSETLGELLRDIAGHVVAHTHRLEIRASRTALRQRILAPEVKPARSPTPQLHTIAEHDLIRFEVAARSKRCGKEVRLVIPPASEGQDSTTNSCDALLKALMRAHDWRQRLIQGEAWSLSSLAQQDQLNVRYVGRLLQGAFLSPNIVEAVLSGHSPAGLNLELFRKRIPPSWSEQKVRVRPAPDTGGAA